MGLEVKDSGGGDFTPVPQGVHHAVCVSIYDIGTQVNPMYQTEKEQLVVTWEIPGQRLEYVTKEGDKIEGPMVISKYYTASLHEKANLRGDLEGWREKAFTAQELDGFHMGKLLGVNCMIQVIHDQKKDKIVAKVKVVLKKMANLPDLKPERKMLIYALKEPDMNRVPQHVKAFMHWGKDIPEDAPGFIKAKILQSKEWAALYGQPGETSAYQAPYDDTPPPAYEDDIPF